MENCFSVLSFAKYKELAERQIESQAEKYEKLVKTLQNHSNILENKLKIFHHFEIVNLKNEHSKEIEIKEERHESEIKEIKISHQSEIDELKTVNGKDNEGNDVNIVISRTSEIKLVDKKTGIILSTNNIPYGSNIFVKNGQKLKKGSVVCQWDPYNGVIIYSS